LESYRGIFAADGTFLARLRATILHNVSHIQEFMRLLMKPRNGMPWSAEDKAALRCQLRQMAKALPAFGVFSLPGGMFLLPLLAIILDRRRMRRKALPAATPEKQSELP
jgi:hypothetical protein